MLQEIASVNGKIVPAAEAQVPVDNIEFTYGFGVYESMRVRKGILFFPEAHVKRLFSSAATIDLSSEFSEHEILSFIKQFVAAIEEQSYNIKMLLVGKKQGSTLYIFASAPKYIPEKAYKNGVRVIVREGERHFPQAKTLSMLTSFVAFKAAKSADAYDALMVDAQGNVREGTRSNLFYTDGKTIFTPPAEDVLEGVTRAALFDILPKHDIPVQERRLSKDELGTYSGFFLTSTSAKVLPISQIADDVLEIPQIVRDVVKIYSAYEEEYRKRRKD